MVWYKIFEINTCLIDTQSWLSKSDDMGTVAHLLILAALMLN